MIQLKKRVRPLAFACNVPRPFHATIFIGRQVRFPIGTKLYRVGVQLLSLKTAFVRIILGFFRKIADIGSFIRAWMERNSLRFLLESSAGNAAQVVLPMENSSDRRLAVHYR